MNLLGAVATGGTSCIVLVSKFTHGAWISIVLVGGMLLIFSAPLLDAVDEVARKHAGRSIAVVVPELVEARWYHSLLHGQTGALLRHQLRARGGPQLVILTTPWYLRDWLPERHWLSSFARRLGRRRAASTVVRR